MLGDYEHNVKLDFFFRKKKVVIQGYLEENKETKKLITNLPLLDVWEAAAILQFQHTVSCTW